MPVSAKSPCRQSGCAELVSRSGYCEAHKRKSWSSRRKGTTTERGYGADWRKLRKLVIKRDGGLCQPCKRNGRLFSFDDIDHINPKTKGGTDALSNLQCICKPCHKTKTSAKDNRG